MRSSAPWFALVLLATLALDGGRVDSQPPDHHHQGQGLVLELDNAFIKEMANRATLTTTLSISGISAVHPAAKDGEIHVGGWAAEAGLPCVAEVMNAATLGKPARLALAQAKNENKAVTVTGAWRLWGEHAGLGAQIQQRGPMPNGALHGDAPSNPDHVFEIHPVTTIKVGAQVTDAAVAIGETPGFTPHDAHQAFLLGYEKLACTILPKPGDRTRIITQALGFNFTTFIIRLDEDPVALDDGHGVICSVYDTDGELLVRNRRMVFLQGTEADQQLHGLAKGKRLKVTGIPRISLKLVQYRLDHYKDKDAAGNPKFDTNPLEWRLPYEMIIVAAQSVGLDDD